ncbi:MAG TPA: Gfo/Idh/MocA family oxidoreductase [Acidimicrobiales bacterium]|nr:Gfo/Idh/MocA family oxidoreductase [Acidimicrobiales bacterium]
MTGEGPLRVGLVGCGTISAAYLRPTYRDVTYVACADLDPLRAKATAEAHGMRATSVEELLADPEVEAVCNLTVPKAHVDVSTAALRAGKHVYSEKPLGLDLAGAAAMLRLAEEKGLQIGCAPDTFLGAGLQTCRQVLDSGRIGEPVAAMAHLLNHGPENWHPDPGFYFLAGGGPMLDMGPYYLTALVSLLGPIRRVLGVARPVPPPRVARWGPRATESFPVEVPLHVAGIIEHAGGAVATISTSFEVWKSDIPRFELHGTEASLSLPDPNTFGGPVKLFPAGASDWEEVPTDGFGLHQRGIGLACMAAAIRRGRAPAGAGTALGAGAGAAPGAGAGAAPGAGAGAAPGAGAGAAPGAGAGAAPGAGASSDNRASGRLAYHVLDAMLAIIESAGQGCEVLVQSSAERPAPMPAGLD